jgi:hypothetical protein
MLAACARGGGDGAGPDGSSGGDGPRSDGPPAMDGMVDTPQGGGPVPLLITEVVLAPTEREMIEIANPTNQAISLSGYYLSDHRDYFRVPAGAPAVDVTDFIVKFPAGAVIGPKAVITVAVDLASAYQNSYGVAPTFAIGGGATATMVSVSANGIANLTNAGELVALFYWNGQDDVVRDVDIMLAGVPTATNGLTNKSGIALDGPDGGPETTAYATDALTIPVQQSAPPTPLSTKRIMLETGHETQGGTGNGLTGDDETSENTAVTWDTAFTAPTPGVLPPGLIP